MRTFLLITIFFGLSFSKANSQILNRDSLTHEAGRELVQYHHIMAIGTGMMVLGSSFGTLGLLMGTGSNSDIGIGIGIIGYGIAAIGGIYTLSAPKHIGKAGKILLLLSGQPMDINWRTK